LCIHGRIIQACVGSYQSAVVQLKSADRKCCAYGWTGVANEKPS